MKTLKMKLNESLIKLRGITPDKKSIIQIGDIWTKEILKDLKIDFDKIKITQEEKTILINRIDAIKTDNFLINSFFEKIKKIIISNTEKKIKSKTRLSTELKKIYGEYSATVKTINEIDKLYIINYENGNQKIHFTKASELIEKLKLMVKKYKKAERRTAPVKYNRSKIDWRKGQPSAFTPATGGDKKAETTQETETTTEKKSFESAETTEPEKTQVKETKKIKWKKDMTDEEKKEYKEQKEKVLKEKINATLDTVFTNQETFSKMMKSYHIKDLYRYSATNRLLINLHGGTLVKSFKAWSDIGGKVKKGAVGIPIYVPLFAYKCSQCNFQTFSKKTADAHEHETKKKIQGFKTGYVFDISQIQNANELDLKYEYTPADKVLLSFEEVKTIISNVFSLDIEEETIGHAHGYWVEGTGKIFIDSLLTDAQKVKTLFHEAGHFLMNHDQSKTQSSKETEAETISLLCYGAIGGNTELSQAYIEGYRRESNVIDKQGILRAVNKIMKAIEQTIKIKLEIAS